MKKPKHIHFVGIKGVGMTPLAIIAKEAGIKVSGCDIDEEFITDRSLREIGVKPLIGFSEKHVQNVDLVIFTGAHGGFDNEEVIYAKKKGVTVWTQGQAVGEFMKGDLLKRNFEGISVTGTHGKTTTTAILATVFAESGLDPTYIVGTGSVASIGLPGHLGRGRYFIAEADEYATEPKYDLTPKFLWQHPQMIILTNIELDHPDLYTSLEDTRNAYRSFVKQLPGAGVLIACGDDPQIIKLISEYKGSANLITYGFSPKNTYVLTRVNSSLERTFFLVETQGRLLGEFMIKVPGEHNALNALASVIAAVQAGIRIENIAKGLKQFSGAKRRFEYVGDLPSGARLYDDYAHHPTEIKKTLHAFRQAFLKSKLVCIFQPHTYSRTKKLFEQFIDSFYETDSVIITNIYSSLREEEDLSVSSEKLVQRLLERHRDVLFLPTLSDVVEYVKQKRYGENVIVITMGAGDIYKISEKLTQRPPQGSALRQRLERGIKNERSK